MGKHTGLDDGPPNSIMTQKDIDRAERVRQAAPQLLAKCKKIVAWLEGCAAQQDQHINSRFITIAEAAKAGKANFLKTAEDIKKVISLAENGH